MNFTWEALEAAQTTLYRAHRIFADLKTSGGSINSDARVKFELALNDDLNTPEALALLWEVLRSSTLSDADKRETILHFDKVFGLGFSTTSRKTDVGKIAVVSQPELPESVKILLEKRTEAREGGDWALADELRDAIAKEGFTVDDTKSGTEVRRS
jgi:cysteinyl-tRNA synthetase